MAHFPCWLPLSAVTDVTLVLRGHKPAARVSVGRWGGELRRWARRHGLFTSLDADGFAAISRNPATARRVIDLDRRPGRHTLALGTMLGYPPCCSRAAARVGDESIDQLHAAMATRRYHGRFRAINPSGYADGISRLSHVPCSHSCLPSLRLAVLSQVC